MHLFIIKCFIIKVNPDVKHGLGMTTMYQYRHIGCNKSISFVQDVDNEETMHV